MAGYFYDLALCLQRTVVKQSLGQVRGKLSEIADEYMSMEKRWSG
jgi:hypothetical protein